MSPSPTLTVAHVVMLAMAVAAAATGSAALAASPSQGGQRVPLIAYQGCPLATVWPDGSHDRCLTGAGMPADARHMDWSPDGAQLVFESDQAEDGSGDLWVVDADGAHARRLRDATEVQSFDFPAWSPDGRSIAYVRYDLVDGHQPGSTIEVVDLGSMAVTTVATTSKPDYVTAARWSPDATQLVVEVDTFVDFERSNETVAGRLAIIDLSDPAHSLRFLAAVDGAGYPDWHPSGDRILFQAGWQDPEAFGDGLLNLYTIRPDGTGLVALTAFSESDPVVWMPTWSADGSSILVTLTARIGGKDPIPHTIGRLEASGTGLEQVPGPVFGAHPRQSRGTLLENQ